MRTFHIKPSTLSGSLSVPPSKSHTLRAILFGLMGKGKTTIHHYLHSPDTEAMLHAIKQLGAKVSVTEDKIEIQGVAGKLLPSDDVIQCGNSGQVLRFIGALAALLPTYTVLTGDHSIRHNRPVKPLLSALEQLGAFSASMRQDGYAPIIVRGPMTKRDATLSGEDSQPVSALLIAASFLPYSTTLTVTNPGEKPWIDLTLEWLKKLGMQVVNHNYERYEIAGHGAYDGFEITIPGDFSSASYPIAAALVTQTEITLNNVDMNDVQGDKKLIEILIRMGAQIETDPVRKTLTVKRGKRLQGMQIDLNDCIDMITIVPVIACFAEGETVIVNAAIARKKESDRIHAIAVELKKMGAQVEEREDGLRIIPSKLKGATVSCYSDHRMALALSVAALAAEGESVIEGVECISKTYPTFQRDFQALGGSIQ